MRELFEAALSVGFNKLLGVELVSADADRVELRLVIRPELQQPYGILHGGVHASLVELAASLGAAAWFGERGHVVGVTNTTHFLRAVREGTLHVVATPIHRGRTMQLWLVESSDDEGRSVARGELRVANIESADGLGRS